MPIGASRGKVVFVTRVLLDGFAIREQGSGVSRVLREVLPLLAAEHRGLDYVIVSTAEGVRALGTIESEVVTAPSMPNSVWEQFGLPWYARRLRADAVYSHSECCPLWGAPVLLHVPEDPYIRWDYAPAITPREHVRRVYQRLVLRRSMYRARPLVTSCEPIAQALRARFGADLVVSATVALGVDTNRFYPDSGRPSEDYVFHLGSATPRDQSPLVARAYASALAAAPDLPNLLIAGKLGKRVQLIDDAVRDLGIGDRVQLLGYISDNELRQRYSHAAMCIQPANYEGFGLQPLEALACGAPLIVFPEPAVREAVGDAAVIVSDKSEAALAQAIVGLWGDRASRGSLREAGPKRAAMMTWTATARTLHELLLEWTSSRGHAPLRPPPQSDPSSPCERGPNEASRT